MLWERTPLLKSCIAFLCFVAFGDLWDADQVRHAARTAFGSLDAAREEVRRARVLHITSVGVGFDLLIPRQDFENLRHGAGVAIINDGFNLRKWALESSEVLVDVGANIGSITVWAARVLGVRHVYALEPSRRATFFLVWNIFLNNVSGSVTVLDEALVSEAWAGKLIAFSQGEDIEENEICGLPGYNTCRGTYEVKTVGLKDIASRIHAQFGLGIGALKVNCEGCEADVFGQDDFQILTNVSRVTVEMLVDDFKDLNHAAAYFLEQPGRSRMMELLCTDIMWPSSRRHIMGNWCSVYPFGDIVSTWAKTSAWKTGLDQTSRSLISTLERLSEMRADLGSLHSTGLLARSGHSAIVDMLSSHEAKISGGGESQSSPKESRESVSTEL